MASDVPTGKGARIVQPHYPVVRVSSQGDRANQQLVISEKRSAVSEKRSAVGGQRSAVSGQRSAISGQRSAVSEKLIH
ncbi:MAG: hypothetical protein KME42_13385 [Tildeniella nuda ZEHNDER 1965/U140]|nr:hypothetical protein [Tildeniella nuda ZEHNDER 1965/U140]